MYRPSQTPRLAVSSARIARDRKVAGDERRDDDTTRGVNPAPAAHAPYPARRALRSPRREPTQSGELVFRITE